MLIQRRSLILGLVSTLAAPSIVRATSLMPLRGYNMDPLVLAWKPVRGPEFLNDWQLSMYWNSASVIQETIQGKAHGRFDDYAFMRRSEIIIPTHLGNPEWHWQRQDL